MLREVDDATLVHHCDLTGRGWIMLRVGLHSLRVGDQRVRRGLWAATQRAQLEEPVFLASLGSSHYWQFQGRVYVVHDGSTEDQVRAELLHVPAPRRG